MTCVRVCLGFLQITIRRARGCDHWPWGLWSHAARCSCFWVGIWGDFDSGSLDDTPVRGLGGHSPKPPRVTTPLKQCQESGPVNRAVRTTRGRRTRSWWHCTERAAKCCQSCGANPAGHARRTRWASTSESGAVTALTAQDRTEKKQRCGAGARNRGHPPLEHRGRLRRGTLAVARKQRTPTRAWGGSGRRVGAVGPGSEPVPTERATAPVPASPGAAQDAAVGSHGASELRVRAITDRSECQLPRLLAGCA